MSTSHYRQLWSELKNKTEDPETVGRLAGWIAASFLDEFLKDGSYIEDHITLLCEMSTHGPDPQPAQTAARALFGTIIERLCDEFEELPGDTYNQVMAQVLSFCRRLPVGATLDQRLTEAGIDSHRQIVARIDRIRKNGNLLTARQSPGKIFILSRVTLGADVAVTSIILQRLAALFTKAELILLGSQKCRQIFGGWKRLTIVPMAYQRKGGLFERLESWHQAHKIIEDYTGTGDDGRHILIDPDSRLSQLGLLPLMPEENYSFFNSRSADAAKGGLSIGALTNTWLDRISGNQNFTFPGVWPQPDNLHKAATFCDRLRSNGARRLIVINFGVGGNPRKRVGRQFEHDLLHQLLEEPDTVILLDKGFGEEESESARLLISALKEKGHRVHECDTSHPPMESINSGVLSLELGIGDLASLLKNSDEYIGYDSAGQHIAAALKVPCVTVFAGSNSMRFIQRWAAMGPGQRHIVHADTLTDPAAVDIEGVIGRVMAARGRE